MKQYTSFELRRWKWGAWLVGGLTYVVLLGVFVGLDHATTVVEKVIYSLVGLFTLASVALLIVATHESGDKQ